MLNQAMILGLVRHGLTLAGGYLAAKGLLDPASVDTVVGALLTIAGAGWSIHSKKA
jgi:uncharacterized protein YaaW (UPF0174 family)